MATVNDFEELTIYKNSRELAKQVYAITRQGNKEFKQFLYIAKGSAGEVRSQLNRAFDVGFINKETYDQLYNDVRMLSAGILHFIQSMKTSDFVGSKYTNPSNTSNPSNNS